MTIKFAFILLSLIIRSPVAIPAVVRVHFIVKRDHTHYYDVRFWVIGPGFFQPATRSILTSFAYNQPPAYSLAGLTGFEEVTVWRHVVNRP